MNLSMNIAESRTQIKQENIICRICLNVVKNAQSLCNCIFQNVITHCFPNLNLSISLDPVICKDCLDIAKKACNLYETFMETEEKIQNYYDYHEKDINSLCSLNDIKEFLSDSVKIEDLVDAECGHASKKSRLDFEDGRMQYDINNFEEESDINMDENDQSHISSMSSIFRELSDSVLPTSQLQKASSQNNESEMRPLKTAHMELLSLLKSWNQEKLFDHLVAEHVFINVLKVMKRHHIEKLLKNFTMGTFILFEHHLEEWRQFIGMPMERFGNTVFSAQPQNDSTLETDRNGLNIQTSTGTTSMSLNRTYLPTYNSLIPDNDNMITLSVILNESPRGKILAEFYRKFSKFRDEQRTLLINVIAQYFEEKNIQMSLSTSHQLEKEILERFPTEKLEYYRTSKRGKIYNKCCNLKTIFKTSVSKHVLPKKQKKVVQPSRRETDFVPEQDAESYIRFLKNENLTEEQFDSCWKACTKYRLNEIKTLGNTAEILEKWPFYKYPNGFRLIEMDFKAIHDCADDFLKKWELSYEKILLFLINDNHIKDKNVKSLLEKMKDGKNISDDSRYALVLWSLHGYFVPTNKIVTKDADGKKNIIKFTIKDSQESFLFIGRCMEEIEDHLLDLKKRNKSIPPFILCVGQDILSIQEIYVYFEGTKFKFDSFLKAVDVCFKIIYVFDLNFPHASVMFWNFIETYFFKLNSRHSFSKVHVLSETITGNKEATPTDHPDRN